MTPHVNGVGQLPPDVVLQHSVAMHTAVASNTLEVDRHAVQNTREGMHGVGGTPRACDQLIFAILGILWMAVRQLHCKLGVLPRVWVILTRHGVVRDRPFGKP